MAFQVAPNLEEALVVFARTMGRAAPHLAVHYARDPDGGTVEVRSDIVGGRLFDALAMETLALCYRLAENVAAKVGREARLFVSASGIRQQVLAQELLCPVRFGADCNRLMIPAALLAARNPRHDPILWELLRRPRSARRDQEGDAIDISLTGRIRRDLQTSRRVPRLKQVAGDLNMSERTIIRQLNGEGTSFRQLVDDERMRRAIRLVNDRSIELARVADLLGFADAPSFWRTFRRWFGVTPTEFRQ
jgi:AraC-like DNA-binding protein